MQMQGYMTRLGRWRALSERTRARDEVSPGLAVYMWTCGLTSLGLVCVFWPSPYLLTALLALDGALMLRARRSSEDLAHLIFCGAFGALAEVFGIGFGAWSYTLPQASGVPLWLPLIWGIAALFVKEIGMQISAMMAQARRIT